MPKITVITPCYFNELNIPDYAIKMIENEKIFPQDVIFEYILIDDGSKDGTWEEMLKFQKVYPQKVKLVKLVRNFGSTNAVFSGLNYSTGNCNVIISADLQDPPDLILKMYQHWLNGFKLVIAKRENREEPFLQKAISNITHFLVKKWGLKNLPKGGFDLNLFDETIKEVIINMKDKNSYFPYLLIWLGYEFVSIPYIRKKRELGKSSYTLAKKIKSFIDSFVAFSFFPIRLISISGIFIGIFAFIYSFIIFGKIMYIFTSGLQHLFYIYFPFIQKFCLLYENKMFNDIFTDFVP